MQKEITIKFFFNEGNWGDKISPKLVEMISGIKPTLVKMQDRFIGDSNQEVYLTVGSIMKFADNNTVVWGSGFIREEDGVLEKPKKVCAVRGPLSRDKLLKLGIDCPKVYGDPVLLMPRFYQPKKLARKKIGIIPHYVDQDHSWIKKIAIEEDVKIIDIRGDYFDVIDEICSCDYIASSSLHGLILADAYGIPSLWLKLSDKLWGGDFKFQDYFLSINKEDKNPLNVDENTILNDLYKRLIPYKINIDLDALYKACPFKKAE